MVPRQSEYAPQQTLQQYQPPVDIGMPMNVSMNTDGFPENVLTTNQVTSNIPDQVPSTNNINPFTDTPLLGKLYKLQLLFIDFKEAQNKLPKLNTFKLNLNLEMYQYQFF